MDPRIGLAGFRIGVFIGLTSGVLLLAVERDSAEFVIAGITLAAALAFLAFVAVLSRR